MKDKLILMLALVSILALAGSGLAQVKMGLQDYYTATADGKSPEQNLEDNVMPLLRVFGYYSGGGLYHTAKTHGMLGFDVGIRAIAIKVGDDLKTGWTGSVGQSGGPLGDQDYIALPMIQASLGLPLNLEATARFFSYPIGEAADGTKDNFTLAGIGLKYGLVQNMLFPRVMIMGSYHKLMVPEEFDFADVSTFSMDLVVSKGIPMVATFYGGVGFDNTTMKVEFDLPGGTTFGEEYKTGAMFRGVVGVKFDFIPMMYLNVDYNFGKNQGIVAGLGLSFL
ncbi:hypothetical protein JXJ21_11000 [candidate division KSB1 bacterium]|nr:hypothetical protein [candidate division KSB1 bacterium]